MSKKNSPTMSQAQREEMARQIEQENAYKSGIGQDIPTTGQLGVVIPDGKPVDPAKIDGRVGKLQAALEAGTPKPYSEKDRDKMSKKAEELGKWIAERALTKRQMQLLPRDMHEYSLAVRKSRKWEVGSPEFSEKANEYRDIMRRLNPDDPDAGSIEALRKER